MQAEVILQLTRMIYDAVGHSSRWRPFLEAFVHAIGGTGGSLVLLDTKETAVVCWYGYSDDEIRGYEERYAETDPWRIGTARAPEGTVEIDTALCSREEMEASTAFRGFYLPNGGIHGMGGIILVTSAGRSAIAAVRGADKGPFGETEKAILRPLMPHLKRAALLHGELGSLQRQLATFTDHLNRYLHAFFLTDAQGRVLYANAAAIKAASLQDGLAVENGSILLSAKRQQGGFLEVLAEVARTRGASLRRFIVDRPSGAEPYRLILMPIQDSGAIPLGVSVPAVSIFVISPEFRSEPNPTALCEIFSLTPAEARITSKLALGRSVEEIAAETGSSVETVRTHLKRALAKTRTERQGELISLVLGSVPSVLGRRR